MSSYKTIKILAIETSCDETAVALICVDQNNFTPLQSVISSQVKTHAKFGGVVPEVAARMHIKQILPLIDLVLKKEKIKPQDLNAIAVTGGPGLISSLLVGTETAKALAFAWKKPLIKVNHIEGHVYSSLINEKPKNIAKLFPALSLVVSGGHTELILMKEHGKYKFIGGTRDDAVGEAFDKVAKILNLGYPGGPAVSRLALEYKSINKKLFDLPRPMINVPGFEMSFSGIKTAVLYAWEKSGKTKAQKIAMAYEFQEAVTDVLVSKTLLAAKKYQVKSLFIGGGVAANQRLRSKLTTIFENNLPEINLKFPAMENTGDNALMIALPAYFHYLKKDFQKIKGFRPDPNWELVR